MNPRYSFSAKIFIEHGNNEPTPSDIEQIQKKVEVMSALVFGDKLIQSPDVLVIYDEEPEIDWIAKAEVQVTLRVSASVTNQNPHDAECIAQGLFEDIDSYLSINSDESGIDTVGIEVNKVTILDVEEDTK